MIDQKTKKNFEKKPIIGTKYTIAISCAKGGVGKSTFATNLALALKKIGWSIKDLDLIESNEAFAAQSIAVIKELKVPKEKLNVNGGAIAIGHPIGASGARLIVTLIHEMIKRDNKKGLVTLCIGGGMGISMCIARD